MANPKHNAGHITTERDAGARIICFPGTNHPAANAVTSFTTLAVAIAELEAAFAEVQRCDFVNATGETEETFAALMAAHDYVEFVAIPAFLAYRCRTDGERGRKAIYIAGCHWFDDAEVSGAARFAAIA